MNPGAENLSMKRIVISFILIASIFSAYAKEVVVKPDTYDYDIIVSDIRGVQSPQVVDKYVIFTAENNARNVGIAFDFENYTKIHSFKIRRTYDIEGKETGSWFFYVLERPKKLESISYKIIIDGLWTTDPTNENTIYDWENGVQLSQIKLPVEHEHITETVPEGFTRFVCNTEPGKKVRLGGTFTDWDSWIYEMTEVQPGKYEILLPLPAGTYYYAYYVGMKSFIDTTNPVKAYSKEGKVVSKLTVN